MGMTYRSSLSDNVRKLEQGLHREISEVIAHQATRGEASLKNNAPWTDRTGAARSLLSTSHQAGRSRWEIIFAHGVSYGIYLEEANDGKYRVIMPTVRLIGADMQQQLRDLMSRVR